MSENESLDPEIIPPTAIEAQERVQVDMQIATARRWPRIISAVKQRMLSYATLDEETAEGCFYTLPPRKDKDGKMVRFQGPSVRLAEIALASYQHVKAGARIIGDDGKFITAQSVVHDLENNVSVSIEVRRRVTTRDGKRFGDDMIATTGNAAISFALRNAVFRVVPRALIMPVYEQAKRVAVGDVKSLVSKRAKIIERLSKYGVTVEMILNSLGVAKVDDIGLDQMEILIGHGTSLKDGEFTLEELFPQPGAPAEDKPAGPSFKTRQAAKPPEPPKTDPIVEVVPEAVAKQAEAVVEKLEALTAPAQEAPKTPQEQLAEHVSKCGGTFDNFVTLCRSQNWVKPEVLDPWTCFADMPDALAKKFLGAKRGVENGIKAILETKAQA